MAVFVCLCFLMLTFMIQSADDFSDRSLRLTEISREHTNFQEEEERDTLLDTPKGKMHTGHHILIFTYKCV